MKPTHVNSEIGPLKRVLLHRPGRELDRITVENRDEFLFDDILWLREAQREHNAFADLLRAQGVEVVYFQELLARALRDKSLRAQIITDRLLVEGPAQSYFDSLRDYLAELSPDHLAEILIAGFTVADFSKVFHGLSLTLDILSPVDFVVKPVPNLYFMRDPHSFIFNGLVVSQMQSPIRRPESVLSAAVFKHVPPFKGLPIWNEGQLIPFTFEGGDILVLSDKLLAVGISIRTESGAVEQLGRLLSRERNLTILAITLPRQRTFMHLDTIFTMVDVNKFICYQGILPSLRIFQLDFSDGRLLAITPRKSLLDSLRENLGQEDIHFISTGAGDTIHAARDQWHDGANTFTLAPGRVITYERNENSNRALTEAGIEVLTFRGDELGRGRGGPRCMSMPLYRDSLPSNAKRSRSKSRQ